MNAVDLLLATEDIKRLKARYFRFVDTQNWAEFRRLFTDDAILEFPESMTAPCSINDFMPLVETMLAGVTSVHHGHMPEITIESDDEARAIWAMDDILNFPQQGGSGPAVARIRGYGHYHETYRKQGDVWLIRTLRLSRLRLEKIMMPQSIP
jgi:SnoaL-like domain